MLKSSFTRLSNNLLKNVLQISSYKARNFCVIENKNEQEVNLINKLKIAFPNSAKVDVIDVSGGCGAMFEVTVVSDKFKGIKMVKQHQLVNEALKEDIKEMHGIRISTAASLN